MKRILIALPLWAGLALPFEGHFDKLSASPQARPLCATASLPAPMGCEVSGSIVIDLPWSTVSAVLKRVSELHPYSYTALVDGYDAGLVTVEQSGSGYLVQITDEDGLTQQVLIDDL